MKEKLKKSFMFTLWLVCMLLAWEAVSYMLTAPDTWLNICSFFVVYGIFYLSYETKCFTQFNFKKKDEDNKED